MITEQLVLWNTFGGCLSARKLRKQLRNPYPMTCRKKWQTLILKETEQKLFQSYRNIGNVQEQWHFINSNINIVEKPRSRTNGSPKKSRR